MESAVLNPSGVADDELEPTPLGGTEEVEALATEAREDDGADSEADPLAGLTLEQIKALPSLAPLITDIEARKEESARQRIANARTEAQLETQRREQAIQAQRESAAVSENGRRWAASRISELYAKAEESGEPVTADAINGVFEGIGRGWELRAAVLTQNVAKGQLQEQYPSYEIPQDMAELLQQATARKDQALVSTITTGLLQDAAYRQGLHVGAALQQKGLIDKTAADAEAERVRSEARAKATAQRPTNVGGAGSPGRVTRAQYEAMSDSEWAQLPAADRAAIKKQVGVRW